MGFGRPVLVGDYFAFNFFFVINGSYLLYLFIFQDFLSLCPIVFEI